MDGEGCESWSYRLPVTPNFGWGLNKEESRRDCWHGLKGRRSGKCERRTRTRTSNLCYQRHIQGRHRKGNNVEHKEKDAGGQSRPEGKEGAGTASARNVCRFRLVKETEEGRRPVTDMGWFSIKGRRRLPEEGGKDKNVRPSTTRSGVLTSEDTGAGTRAKEGGTSRTSRSGSRRRSNNSSVAGVRMRTVCCCGQRQDKQTLAERSDHLRQRVRGCRLRGRRVRGWEREGVERIRRRTRGRRARGHRARGNLHKGADCEDERTSPAEV